MPRDGNGQYTLPTGNPVVPGTIIESEWANSTMQDLGQGLSTSIAYDGQTVPVNNLPMGNYRHTGVSDPSSRNQYNTLGMAQDGRDTRVILQSGTNDLIGSLVGQMSSYVAGQFFTFQALASNTGAVTININGIGPRDLTGVNGDALLAGQIVLGKMYQIFYTGTQFQLMNASSVQALATVVDQNSISGWTRPDNGTYPPITLVDPTTVRIPEGRGYIVPPGDVDENSIVEVNWVAQDVPLDYLVSAFTTTLAIDATGNVIQIPDQVLSSVYRNYIILGVVSHVTDVVTGIATRPEVHGDDGYLFRDLTRFLTGILASGGQVSQSGANPLSMDIQEGIIFLPGGDVANPDSPNLLEFPTQIQISFLPLAGQNTVAAATTLAPVTNYDPNFGGVITPIPGGAGTTVIHRLYWQNGTYVWEYGQRTYSTLAIAIQNLAYERAIFKVAKGLFGATMICELAISKNCLALSDQATCIIIPRGGFEYVIGSAGGLDEAPQDGNTYGRKNATWTQVLDASTPNLTGDITITKAQPRVNLDYNPVGAGWSGLSWQRVGVPLFELRSTLPEETLTFRTYDDAGVLLSTTQLNQAGDWLMPGAVKAKTLAVNTGILSAGASDVDFFITGTAGDNVVVQYDTGTVKVNYSFGELGLTLPVAPTLAGHATTKQYVDQRPQFMTIALGDEVSPVAIGIKDTFRMGLAFTLTGIKASLNVAQAAGALFTIDLLVNGASILSTKLTFNNGSDTTVGATTPPVITTPAIPNDAKVQIEVTQIGDGTAIGPKFTLLGYPT